MHSARTASQAGSFVCRRVLSSLAMALIALACVLASTKAHAERGYGFVEVEAAMLQKIASFVRWPEAAGLKAPGGRLIITVLGSSPLLPRLRLLYAKPNASSPPAVVRSVERREQIGKTHILFVTRGFSEQLSQILDQIGDSPTLIVGDTPGFAARGAAVNLYREGDRVRFEINRRALEHRHLHASYQLLSLARLVEGL